MFDLLGFLGFNKKQEEVKPKIKRKKGTPVQKGTLLTITKRNLKTNLVSFDCYVKPEDLHLINYSLADYRKISNVIPTLYKHKIIIGIDNNYEYSVRLTKFCRSRFMIIKPEKEMNILEGIKFVN